MHYGDTLYHTGHICPGGAAGAAGCPIQLGLVFYGP